MKILGGMAQGRTLGGGANGACPPPSPKSAISPPHQTGVQILACAHAMHVGNFFKSVGNFPKISRFS